MSFLQKHKLEPVYKLVKPDLGQVDASIVEALRAGASLAAIPLLDHVLNAQGKRVRPVLAILSFYTCMAGKQVDSVAYQRLLDVSSAIELVHTASLIHDDVIDHAQTRRDQVTINAKWGNESAVALGVYVYSVSLGLIAKAGLISILADLSETVRMMCEGELFQLADRRDINLTVDRYLSIVDRKTAVLFSTACFSGAVVSGVSDEMCMTMRDYGRALGFLFQLTDDYLDFFGSDGDLKKEIGQDIDQGQMTLPLLFLRDRLSDEESKILVDIIQNGRREKLDWIITKMQQCTISNDYMVFMDRFICDAENSLSKMPVSHYRDALHDVLSYIVQRIGLRKD